MYLYYFVYVFLLYVYVSSSCLRATMTEVFPCYFLISKVNARVKPANTGHGPHSSKIFVVLHIVRFVLFCVLFVCKCVLYYCHQVATEFQSTNISYHTHLYHIYVTKSFTVYSSRSQFDYQNCRLYQGGYNTHNGDDKFVQIVV